MTTYRERRLSGVHSSEVEDPDQPQPEPEPQPQPEVPPPPDDEDLEELTVEDLKERLAALDLPVSGNKPELIERLQAGA